MTTAFNDYGIKACASGLDLHGGGNGRRCEWQYCLLTCRILSVQLGNFGENIQRVLSSKSLYSWLLLFLYFFFNCELCQLDLLRFVFLCTNLKFTIGSRRLSGSHHITMLLETKCLPLQSQRMLHHQNPGRRLFVEKLLQPVVFFLWRCTCACSTCFHLGNQSGQC